jgi:hypothetical protein
MKYVVQNFFLFLFTKNKVPFSDIWGDSWQKLKTFLGMENIEF